MVNLFQGKTRTQRNWFYKVFFAQTFGSLFYFFCNYRLDITLLGRQNAGLDKTYLVDKATYNMGFGIMAARRMCNRLFIIFQLVFRLRRNATRQMYYILTLYHNWASVIGRRINPPPQSPSPIRWASPK